MAIFGSAALAMDHKMNSATDTNCVSSFADKGPCPTELVARTIHHISSSQAILNAIIPTFNPLLVLALLAIVFVAIHSLFNTNEHKFGFLYRELKYFDLIAHRARKRFVSWLSLLENSPAF